MICKNILVLTSILLFAFSSVAQVIPVGNGWVNTAAVSGKGLITRQDGPTQSQRADIQKMIEKNIQVLKSKGILPETGSSNRVSTSFSLPIALQAGINDYSFYSITGYVDHDSTYPNHLLDYHCGNLTYDTQNGYNHQGTDFYLWPFSWYKMDHQQVKVVAAAAGTIIMKQDGNFDRSCSMNSNQWNAVYILHSDNSVAWYGHLKKGSLTSKNIGESVATGEMLGIVGSSGNSTGPHLHFEVYDSGSHLIDPFSGTCNNFNGNSWWINQLPYKESGINKTMTNFAPPEFPACPTQELPNESDVFSFNDTVWVSNYFRYLNTGDLVSITIKRPDGSVWYNWDWTSSWPFYSAAYAYWWIKIGIGEPSGLWTFQTVYKSMTYIHQFTMGYPAGLNSSNLSTSELRVYPNPASDILRLVQDGNRFNTEDLQIVNLLGKRVAFTIATSTANEIQLDISALESGLYLLIYRQNCITRQKTFVKQ